MSQTVIPYIVMKNASRAIEFYQQVFGAVETGARFTEPGGRIGHAEIEIGGSKIMLADEHPELGIRGPESLGGTPLNLYVSVPNSDETVARAGAAGAKVLRPVETQPYGDRSGTIEDPFGHRWMIATHVEDVSKNELQRRVGSAYEIR